ncbi:hypothetical protein AaE_013923 [Aphanomyces astaci]|uniref:Uncharacterized protein n=1 Tax=Aphanomyces astaci TaxID=112090 RepID=A0A6A4Z5L7_APHAT|nr:hypothetical protein AaE_013923 [Aphanomyces astaci]
MADVVATKTASADLTADQIARMEESRKKALERTRRRLDETRRQQLQQQQPIRGRPSATEGAPPPSIPLLPNFSLMVEPTTTTRRPTPTLPPSVTVDPAETTPEMPSFNLLPSFNVMATPPRVGFSIAYHPRIRSSALLLAMFGHDALPKVPEPSLECDLLLSARRALLVVSFSDFASLLHAPSQCPHLNVLAAFGSITYLVQSTPQVRDGRDFFVSPQARQECSAYAAKYSGMEIVWTEDPAHTLQLVLEIASLLYWTICCDSQEAKQGHGLVQYEHNRGKDPHFLDRWQLFHAVPHLSFGGQQALATRFPNLPVTTLLQMNTRFNPMHWKRMLPWISDTAAQSIHSHLKSKL